MYNPYLKIDISETIDLIHEYGTKFTYNKNQVIIKPGDKINEFHYIEEGSVRYLLTGFNGVEHVIMISNKGGFFGVAPLCVKSFTPDNQPSRYTLITETQTIIYKIEKDAFKNLIKISDDFRDKVIEGLCYNVLSLTNRIYNLSFTSAKDRLYDFYLNSIDIDSSTDDIWYGLRIQYTQEELASIIGVSRMSIYKTIKELCDENLIRIVNRKVEVKMG